MGIHNKNKGATERITFIVDSEQTIWFIMVNDLNVGRNPREVLRVLDALQSKELCPCNWQKCENIINISN
nr:hypothetical protein [Coxiella-like endosymbiont]